MTAYIAPAIYTAQAVGQSVVTHLQSDSPSRFETIHGCRYLFHALNLGEIFFGIGQLFQGMDETFNFNAALATWSESDLKLLGWGGVFGSIIFTVLTWVGVSSFNECMRPTENLEQAIADMDIERRENLAITWDNSWYQVFNQCLHVIQIVISVALIFFSSAPLLFVASAVTQIYSFVRTSFWRSINVNRTFTAQDFPQGGWPENIPSLKVSYYHSFFTATDTCQLCGDENVETSKLCVNHSYCKICTIRHFATKSSHFLNGSRFDEKINVNTEDRTATGTIILQKERVCSSCPLDRQHLQQNEIEVTGHVTYNGQRCSLTCEVTLEDPAPQQPGAAQAV